MPSTQWTRSVRAAFTKSVCASKMQAAITGSNTLSCSCPASAAIDTVRSLPITRKQTMFTTSGITGLTLPGMIDEPGCFAGRLISRRPQRGPEESSRRSLQTLESLIARLFMHDE
jgi:hypothetical protein